MSLDAKQLRNALGQFATGICVVTTEFAPNQFKGMTINSFASVSLDPALVLWSIQNDSSCFDLYTKAENFTISVLNEDQQDISNQFATPDNQIASADQLDSNITGAIVDSIAQFRCKAWQVYAGGDHQIIVGEVTDIQTRQGKPLLFWNGNYNTVS